MGQGRSQRMPGQRRGLGTARGGRQEQVTVGDVAPLSARRELALAREVRARELVTGTSPDGIAARIRSECEPAYGTTMIRAYRLALGITLADVVAQVRAWYEAEGRKAPRFGETLLSAYESGQKRPGPEYLHYLCSVYRADPQDLGYPGSCLCRGRHGAAARPSPAVAVPEPAAADQGPSSDDDEELLRRAVLRLRGDLDGDALGDALGDGEARSSAPSTGSGARWTTRCSPGLPPRP